MSPIVAARRGRAGLSTYEGIEGAWSARPSTVHRVFFAVRDPVVAAGRRAGAAGASPGDAVLVLGAGARRAWSALSPAVGVGLGAVLKAVVAPRGRAALIRAAARGAVLVAHARELPRAREARPAAVSRGLAVAEALVEAGRGEAPPLLAQRGGAVARVAASGAIGARSAHPSAVDAALTRLLNAVVARGFAAAPVIAARFAAALVVAPAERAAAFGRVGRGTLCGGLGSDRQRRLHPRTLCARCGLARDHAQETQHHAPREAHRADAFAASEAAQDLSEASHELKGAVAARPLVSPPVRSCEPARAAPPDRRGACEIRPDAIQSRRA